MNITKLKSGFITKFVFDFDDAVAETVLYQYKERVVVCCSTQSGCTVGCKFCGSGNNFARNLTCEEIVIQVLESIKGIYNAPRLQIMFMSMGEPFLNYDNVKSAIVKLNASFKNAELLVSTIGVNTDRWDDFIELSQEIPQVGLQFSVHEVFNQKRNLLIPYKNKLNIRGIRDVGTKWSMATGRPVFLNYCVHENNSNLVHTEELKNLFTPVIFNFTFSVISSKDETMKDAGFRDLDYIRKVESEFTEYNTRIFNPEAQDDIGGGCGQLWHTQKWFAKRKGEKK